MQEGPVQNHPPRVFVLIATAYGRTHWLVHRALRSVYAQVGCDPSRVRILIVDDNPLDSQSGSFDGALSSIFAEVANLRDSLGLALCDFSTEVIANLRTRGHSGSGAWNTGLQRFAAEPDADRSFIALLDDDDEWMPHYLSACLGAVAPGIVAVFPHLAWIDAQGETPRHFTPNDLTPEAFFIGNPGVQGSNMFIATRLLTRIGGFDEAFTSSCDRELMIRLLEDLRVGEVVRVLPEVHVRHHRHDGPSVTMDKQAKQTALDRLYELYGARFSEDAHKRSLQRAWQLFGYQPQTVKDLP